MITGDVSQQCFGHLAARRIYRAQEQYSLLHECAAAAAILSECLGRLQIPQADNVTGTSTSTPTTVARAAPDSGPNKAMAVATASSKKLLAPMRAPGAATSYGTFSHRINP